MRTPSTLTSSVRVLGGLAVVSMAFLFSSTALAEGPDLLKQALELVRQASQPASTAERAAWLNQAISVSQQAPEHRLKGHRVKAIEEMRAALVEIQKGDPDHKAGEFLHEASAELSTSISLAGGVPPPRKTQAPLASPTPQLPPALSAASPSPGSAPLAPSSSASQGDLATVTEIIKRLVANASQKPPGPVENDVTAQTVSTATAAVKFLQPHGGGSVREAIAAEYGQFALEGPLASLYWQAPAALVYGQVKLTAEALADSKDQGGQGPGFGDGGGFSSFVGPAAKSDGQVIATFCLVQQHGTWKVHGVYLSNEVIKGVEQDFIIRQLSEFAKK